MGINTLTIRKILSIIGKTLQQNALTSRIIILPKYVTKPRIIYVQYAASRKIWI